VTQKQGFPAKFTLQCHPKQAFQCRLLLPSGGAVVSNRDFHPISGEAKNKTEEVIRKLLIFHAVTF
jgi:hypothetical protein